jgi:hypothetical protein
MSPETTMHLYPGSQLEPSVQQSPDLGAQLPMPVLEQQIELGPQQYSVPQQVSPASQQPPPVGQRISVGLSHTLVWRPRILRMRLGLLRSSSADWLPGKTNLDDTRSSLPATAAPGAIASRASAATEAKEAYIVKKAAAA